MRLVSAERRRRARTGLESADRFPVAERQAGRDQMGTQSQSPSNSISDTHDAERQLAKKTAGHHPQHVFPRRAHTRQRPASKPTHGPILGRSQQGASRIECGITRHSASALLFKHFLRRLQTSFHRGDRQAHVLGDLRDLHCVDSAQRQSNTLFDRPSRAYGHRPGAAAAFNYRLAGAEIRGSFTARRMAAC